jgi:predicted flavoprotein YhiN
MESKKIERLFFAGECLDIDGVTGGFNFQSAWTTARIAAKHISSPKDP